MITCFPEIIHQSAHFVGFIKKRRQLYEIFTRSSYVGGIIWLKTIRRLCERRNFVMKMKNRISAIFLSLTMMLGAAGCSVDVIDETESDSVVTDSVETEETEETEPIAGITEEKDAIIAPEIAAYIENGTIDVVSNDGNLDLHHAVYTVPNDNTWPYLLSLNDRYKIYVTYEEDGDIDKNVVLNILDCEKAEFTYSIPLDTQYHPHMVYYTNSGWIVYSLKYEDGDEFYNCAYSVEISDDGCEVNEVDLPVGQRNYEYVYSPDGKYAAYRILTDFKWNGGIELVNPDGTEERIFTNDLADPSTFEDNLDYRPMCFLDNTHLLFRVSHGDGYTPLAYYIYDVAAGETVECPMGKYHIREYADGIVYLSDQMSFNDAAAYENIWMTEAENLLDGITEDELTLIASRDENAGVFTIEMSYLADDHWYSFNTFVVNEGTPAQDYRTVLTLCAADFSETEAEIIYDRSLDFEIYNGSIVFVERKVADPFDTLTALLTSTPAEIRENYGEMTYEYSEYGGSPTYSLGKLDGVLVQYISGEPNVLPDDALPYEVIITEDCSGKVCGLTVGMDVSESESTIEWDETWYSVMNGTTHLEVTMGDYTIEAVLNSDIVTYDVGELVPAFDWEDEFLPSPYGEILQFRISPVKEKPVNKAAEYVDIYSNYGELNIYPIALPMTSEDTIFSTFDYDDRFTVYVAHDAIFDEDHHFKCYDNVYVYIIDTKKGKFVYTNRLDTEHCPWNMAYTDSGCVLYSVKDSSSIAYAFEIELNVDGFSGHEVDISRDSLMNSRCVSPDGQYTAVRMSSEKGVDLISPDGTITRILQDKAIDDGYSIEDSAVYSPRGFLDDTHLLYYIGGWEWSKGCGIYDITTGEASLSLDGRYHIQGIANGAVYLKFNERGADTIGGIYDSIWKATPDGKLTMLASTLGDDGVTQISRSTLLEFDNSLWCNYTNTEPGTMIGEFTDTVTVTLYSPDFDETLASIEYPADGKLHAYGNSITVVIPVYLD